MRRACCRRGDVSLGRDCQVVCDCVEVHHPRFLYPPGVLREHYGWFFWQSIQGTVRRLISTKLPDVVIGYWVHPDGEAAVRIARLAGVPSAVIVGGSDVLLITRRHGRRRCVLDVLRATDAVVTVNQHLKETIVHLGVEPERIHVWHQGIDETVFGPADRLSAKTRLGIPANHHALVWVGRMVPVKGLDVLLGSCESCRTR